MAKRRRNADSDAATAEHNTVFVDTSLDTHFAMLVSNSDTVSDFKKKMVLEHAQCFLKIGEIKIHCLKVKRKGNFYHLPDVMLVWSAFHGIKGNWFLSADASGTTTCHLNENSSELGMIDGMKMGLRNADENSCRGLSADVNMTQTRSEMITGFKVDKYLKRATDNYSEENITGTESPVKKKRKVMHPEDLCHMPSLKDSCTLVHASGKDTSVPEIVGCANSMVDVVKDAPGSVILNDQSCTGEGIAFEGTSKPDTAEKNNIGENVNSQDLLCSDKRTKENLLERAVPEKSVASELECEGGQVIPTEQSGDFSGEVPDLSTGLMDVSGATGDLNSDGKKKKKKALETVAQIQDTTDMEQIRNDGSVEPQPETRMSEKEEQKDLSLNSDHEVIMLSKRADSDLALKEASLLQNILDKDVVMEPEISTGYKKKKTKRGKKSVDTTNIEKLGINSTDNGITGSSGYLFLLTDLISEETDKVNGILNDEVKSVQMKSLDSSNLVVNEKVRGANSDEADLLFTQAKQILENIGTDKTRMEKKTQSSVGDVNSDFPTTEEENKIVEFNQVEKDSTNTEVKDKKAKKRKKKRKHTASDLQEKKSVEDQNIGIEALTTEGHSIGVVNSEREEINATLSQVLSHKSEDADTGEQKMEKKTQSSVGYSHADFLAVEEENQISEFKEVEKDTKNMDEKAKKKSKKRKHTAFDVQEKFPVKDPKVGIEALTTEENSDSFVYSEQDGINATSFKVTHGNEDVDTGEEEKVVQKTENSVGNCRADFPPVEENQTVEFDQVDKYSQNTEVQEKSLHKKSKKKSRVKDQKVVTKALTTEENPISSVNCEEEEGRNIASSKVLSHKSKEKLGEMHGTVVNADSPATTSENEGEGINFKQFFVPSDKVEKETKSKDKVTTSRKVEQNGLLSISTENLESKNKRVRKESDGKGGSAQNSDLDEVTPNSSKRKNPSSDKSGSRISEKLPVKKGNMLPLGLNATNKTAMKPPRKKISLMKSGSIFQDNSGESSDGENGILHSDGRHASPSDSSSMSIGESDLSQDSAGNGSNDAKGRSTGRKEISALDLSASKDISMHMILRSSKRFKKAKLVASQNEGEAESFEFVPESQPV